MDLTGYEEISPVIKIDMKWRMKRKDSLCESEIQVLCP